MSDTDTSTDIQRAETPAAQPSQAQPQVDLHLLAEKVYRLMLADLRLEQARSAKPTSKRR